MDFTIGIRREDKNKWEARVPLVPKHIRELQEKHNIQTIIQPSQIRAFSEKEYEKAGAEINESLSEAQVIFAVKEIPSDFFEENKTYVFFSHTIKGQKYNMPMLKKMMDLKCNLIDYEKIVDEKGFRIVFFGRYAGLAGMIDALWVYGQKLKSKGFTTPFEKIKQTIDYEDLDDVKKHLKQIGKEISESKFPNEIAPIIVGFAGYGNVSKGAQEILDILPVKEISPDEIKDVINNYENNLIYKVVFKEEDLVEPISSNDSFVLQDYYKNPQKYKSKFEKYVPDLTILMNCIYWTPKYPRLLTKQFLKENEKIKLEVIGDISVDVNGAIEITEKVTTPACPAFVYDVKKDSTTDGYDSVGIAVVAVDNLPCELPKESSSAFSEKLKDIAATIAKTDFEKDFNDLKIPIGIKNAVILHHGELTPNYQYIDKYL